MQRYNRSGVERVMGFCSDAGYEERRRRFKERQGHPLKQRKLSPIDTASLDKWSDCTRAPLIVGRPSLVLSVGDDQLAGTGGA